MQGYGAALGTDDARGWSENECWFAFRVRANQERAVLGRLLRRDVCGYLPQYCERIAWSDRWRTVEKRLFPGYLFARCAGRALTQVLELSGVVQVLPSNLAPLAVTEDDIATIRRIEACGLPIKPHEYVVGERVTIGAGPLVGISGVIMRARGARFVVSVETFHGRAIAVDLDAESLQSAYT